MTFTSFQPIIDAVSALSYTCFRSGPLLMLVRSHSNATPSVSHRYAKSRTPSSTKRPAGSR